MNTTHTTLRSAALALSEAPLARQWARDLRNPIAIADAELSLSRVRGGNTAIGRALARKWAR